MKYGRASRANATAVPAAETANRTFLVNHLASGTLPRTPARPARATIVAATRAGSGRPGDLGCSGGSGASKALELRKVVRLDIRLLIDFAVELEIQLIFLYVHFTPISQINFS